MSEFVVKFTSVTKCPGCEKEKQILVNEQYNAEFQIGTYKYVVLCDIIPMDVCHVLLVRPWQYEIKVVYDGRKNTYCMERDGRRYILSSLQHEAIQEGSRSNILLMTGK